MSTSKNSVGRLLGLGYRLGGAAWLLLLFSAPCFGTEERSGVECKNWYDPVWNETIEICGQGGSILDSSGNVEILERWEQQDSFVQGQAYAIIDRVGQPDNLFVIQPDGALGVWTGCEFGPCTKKRVLQD